MEGPVFVVVGHTNWGKSSVVATLAADERLAVSRRPGTTQYNQLLPWQMGERTLCTFIDTPGFDAPRHVLRWLKERDRSAVERPSLVQRFVEEHEGSEQFRHECELMRPILAGGIILYVVDTSVPPDAVAEAELQILQWTGRPRMALLNRTRQRDCEEQWRALLTQRFQLIRPFDAHQADFATRLQLLHALRELDPASRDQLNSAIQALQDKRRQQHHAAAASIAHMLTGMASHRREAPVQRHQPLQQQREALAEAYRDDLRQMERRCRESLLEIYEHRRDAAPAEGTGAELLQQDLFARQTWKWLGLTRGQLAGAGAGAGATAGGVVDAGLGGSTFLLGSAIGGAGGGVAGWYGCQRLARVELIGRPMGGKVFRLGPLKNKQILWIALDRAVLFHRQIADRSHATQQPLQAPEASPTPPSAALPRSARQLLQRHFSRWADENRLTELIAEHLLEETQGQE